MSKSIKFEEVAVARNIKPEVADQLQLQTAEKGILELSALADTENLEIIIKYLFRLVNCQK